MQQEVQGQETVQVLKPVAFVLCRLLAIPLSEVCIVFSSSTCLVRVSFEGYTTLSTPSPCDRLSRLGVL